MILKNRHLRRNENTNHGLKSKIAIFKIKIAKRIPKIKNPHYLDGSILTRTVGRFLNLKMLQTKRSQKNTIRFSKLLAEW